MTRIWITFSVEGFHSYPDAPAEVSYLRSIHRHNFQFRVEMLVKHDNREVEFHMLKNFCKRQYTQSISASYQSCEMLAKGLSDVLAKEYGEDRGITVEVSEDGENGAIYYRD